MYALRIEEERREVPKVIRRTSSHPADTNWELFPQSSWQYGLIPGEKEEWKPISQIEMPIGEYPFSPDEAPVQLTAGAKSVHWEVKNAFEAYEMLLDLDPYKLASLLEAHKILMKDLTKEAGSFRAGGVEVFAGEQLMQMALPAKLVPEQIRRLLDWAEHTETHPLIKSCVFHYEFEFIHPFADGNG